MSWWQYLLLVNVYLVLFYAFYGLLLRKETFFQLNRIYLVCAAALSFFIPMMQAGWVQNLFITQEIKYTVYGNPVLLTQFVPVKQASINIGQILAVIYIAGVIVLFGRLIWQLIVLNRIIKKDQHDTAYSFFNKIKLPDEVKDNSIVALHEQVHARQWHSVDVFIIEAVMIMNWFNPIVYFYRRAIKHIHEFIADDHATKEAANKAEYAMLLLAQTFHTPSHNLVNSFFNHSLLKQRIIMLQKDKSQRIKLIKYGLSAPLFMLMLVLTSATVNNSKTVKAINNKITQVLLLPPTTNVFAAKRVDTVALLKKQVQTTEGLLPIGIADTNHISNKQIFAAVEKEPEFPGGSEAFLNFLAKNVQYPAAMRDIDVQGKVIVTYVVEKDGSLSNIRVIKGLRYGADEEAIRVISSSPKWTPGYQNGKPVRVQYTVPIMFSMADAATSITPADTNKKGAVTVVGYSLNKTIQTYYTVDGKEVSNADAQNVINGHNVLMTTVYKNSPDKDKNTVDITTFDKPGQIYMVDGKEVSMTDAKTIVNNNSFHTLGLKAEPSNPSKSIIEITTKKLPEVVLLPPAKSNPLYIVDGKEIKSDDVKIINPNDIKSNYVLKEKAAITQYGSKGKNGVVLVYTKAYTGQIPAANTIVTGK